MVSNTFKNLKNLSTETGNIIENVFINTKNITFYVRNHCNVCVSFPAHKSKIELKIAMNSWYILKLLINCFICVFHISNENTAYLFVISRYRKIPIISPGAYFWSKGPFRQIFLGEGGGGLYMDVYLRFENAIFCSSNCNFLKSNLMLFLFTQ